MNIKKLNDYVNRNLTDKYNFEAQIFTARPFSVYTFRLTNIIFYYLCSETW